MVYLTGAVSSGALGDDVNRVNWSDLDAYLDTKESQDKYEAFRFSVEDALSSLALPLIIENESHVCCKAFSEDQELQMQQLRHYLLSCGIPCGGFKKNFNCWEELIDNGRLDRNRFPTLNAYYIRKVLEEHEHSLRGLNFIHQFYAYRKALVRSERTELVVEKLTGSWFALSRIDLYRGHEQNFSLLDQLKKKASAEDSSTPDNNHETLSSQLLIAIDREYSEELLRYLEQFNKLKSRWYLDEMRYKRLLKKCASKAQTLKFKYLAKDYPLSTELCPRKVLNLRGKRTDQFNAWMLEKMSTVNDRVGRNFSRFGGSWPRFGLGGAVFALLALTSLKKRD